MDSESNPMDNLLVRIEAALDLARFHLREVRRFHDEVKPRFDQMQRQVARERKKYSQDELDLDRGMGHTLDEQFSDDWRLADDLRGVNDQYGVIGLYSVLERFLWMVSNDLLDAGKSTADKRPETLDRFKETLKTAEIDLTQPPFEWGQLVKLNRIRGCLIHTLGFVDETNAHKLKGYGFPQWLFVQLEDGYFEQSWNLVRDTCQALTAQCERLFAEENGNI